MVNKNKIKEIKKNDRGIGFLFYLFAFVVTLVMSTGAYLSKNYLIIVFDIPIALLLLYISYHYSNYLFPIGDRTIKIFILLLFWSFLTLPFMAENTSIWALSTVIILIISMVAMAGDE